MSYVMRATPYRKGRDAGKAYHAAFWAWSMEGRRLLRERVRDRPERPKPPENPYAGRPSASQWKAGFDVEARAPRPKENP
jgi:hypothetical protein